MNISYTRIGDYLLPILKLKSIKDNFNKDYKQKFKQYNNKLNKKENSIYYKDEEGNEYWHHGKLIPKNEATSEEQEELKKLLNDIYEEE